MPRFHVSLYGYPKNKRVVTIVAASHEEAKRRVAASRNLREADLTTTEVIERVKLKCHACGYEFTGVEHSWHKEYPHAVRCVVCEQKVAVRRIQMRLDTAIRKLRALEAKRAARQGQE